MKGYKAFKSDLTCRGFQYEVGKTYHMDGEIELCKAGFHFCKAVGQCFNYYPRDGSRLCEVEASGEIVGSANDKFVTNTITIIRELIGNERSRAIYGNGYGNGDGYRYGNGYGNGNGYRYGNGYGNGDGYGYGNGDGYGYGNGDGYGYRYGYGNGTINKVMIFKED